MTPEELALIVIIIGGDAHGRYEVCVNDECVQYDGTDPPYAYEYKGGIRVVTPGQPWSSEARGDNNCRRYFGSSQQLTNTGHVINRICGYDDGFSIFFMEE